MIRGQISPGNAQRLFEYIELNKFKEIYNWLLQHYTNAKKKDCEKLLLSNELIANVLGQDNKFGMFIEICKQLGFTNIRYLLILRDPVDQALSLYKHRAKGGRVKNMEEWIDSNYHYHIYLKQLFKKLESTNTNIICRKYKKTNKYLDKIMFCDWLQVGEPENDINKKVNPSLSASELLFIQYLQGYNPLLAGKFYDRMLKIYQEDKASDSHLEKYYRQIIIEYLQQFKDTWKLCNQWLGESEELELPKPIQESEQVTMENEILQFSRVQADNLAIFMADCLTLKMQWELTNKKLRRRLGRLKNWLLNINLNKNS